MRRRSAELAVGLGLVLGPLAYALTLEPRTVEVVERIEVERAALGPMRSGLDTTVVPDVTPPVPITTEPAADLDLEPAPVAAIGDDRISFAFVNEAGIVLSTAAELTWGTGRLRSHPGPGEYRAAKRADGRTLPEPLWQQRGRTFDLYGAEGKVCTARLGTLSVLAQHDGPYLSDLFGDDEVRAERADRDPSAISLNEIRTRVWSFESGGSLPDGGAPWLVATILSEGSCAGALWARDATLPAPSILRPSDAPSALTRRRIARFEGSAELAERRAHFDRWRAELGDPSRADAEDWAAITHEYPARVRTWLDDADEPRLLELSFGYQGEICGEGFDSSITRFERMVDGRPEPVTRPSSPLAVIDVDLDGRFEMLYASHWWQWHESTLVDEDTDAPRMHWAVYTEPHCPC